MTLAWSVCVIVWKAIVSQPVLQNNGLMDTVRELKDLLFDTDCKRTLKQREKGEMKELTLTLTFILFLYRI